MDPAAGRSGLLGSVLAAGARVVRRRPDGVAARAAVQALIRAPSREVEFVDASGHRHRVDTRDQMGANALTGRYRLPAAVAARIRPGSMAVDCGANIGIITSQLCQLVGRDGRVWAVEPVAANAARLRWLAERNGLVQLEVLELAVGAADGTATLGLAAPGRSGWASITKSWDVAATVEVPVRPLDGLLADRGGERPTVGFLKVDVEGFEFEVLDGATALLEGERPAIYCEFNDVLLRDRGRSSRELLERFAELGYRPVGAQPTSAELDRRVVNLLLEHR